MGNIIKRIKRGLQATKKFTRDMKAHTEKIKAQVKADTARRQAKAQAKAVCTTPGQAACRPVSAAKPG